MERGVPTQASAGRDGLTGNRADSMVLARILHRISSRAWRKIRIQASGIDSKITHVGRSQQKDDSRSVRAQLPTGEDESASIEAALSRGR